ncbi:MAG: hypothetical protein ACT452_16180 [Microthrixaceae bacterium]
MPPPDPAFEADPLVARLQARVQVLAAQPPETAPRRRVPAPTGDFSVDGQTCVEAQDLNRQLEVLREQLEAAFNDIDARVAAADQRAAAAEALAESADTRAQVASARAANVLYAVDDLAHDLTRMAGADHPGAGRLLSAVDRLRARLQPT